MRAVIKADLRPVSLFKKLWEDREAYDKAIIALFNDLDYSAKLSGQDQLINSEIVDQIFTDVPDDIKNQEEKHLILLGYTSEGQTNFLVSAINPTEIHIRIKQSLFGRLRRSCEEIWLKAKVLRRRRLHGVRLLERLRIVSFIESVTGWEDKKVEPYLRVRKTIEVMEPHRDHATIIGEIVQAPMWEIITRYYSELIILLFTLVTAVALFLGAPYFAPRLQRLLSYFGYGFEDLYVQGALERIDSAFVVTFAITGLGLVIRYFTLLREMPIRWDSGTHVERRSTM